ncbi:hypothetical protein CYMTET_31779 [Cymbomonas tetramitiformis]|uniref:Uncharacterized protein n=1 Tax=Cymbomonas tetramitiformis TaxID=36881 RepID=A0AAE0FH67_9CHLO|nr:hypothetical protein CYMTET_31779 [Cymbomonas tetramitiformis]
MLPFRDDVADGGTNIGETDSGTRGEACCLWRLQLLIGPLCRLICALRIAQMIPAFEKRASRSVLNSKAVFQVPLHLLCWNIVVAAISVPQACAFPDLSTRSFLERSNRLRIPDRNEIPDARHKQLSAPPLRLAGFGVVPRRRLSETNYFDFYGVDIIVHDDSSSIPTLATLAPTKSSSITFAPSTSPVASPSTYPTASLTFPPSSLSPTEPPTKSPTAPTKSPTGAPTIAPTPHGLTYIYPNILPDGTNASSHCISHAVPKHTTNSVSHHIPDHASLPLSHCPTHDITHGFANLPPNLLSNCTDTFSLQHSHSLS